MRKKALTYLLCAAMALGMVACGKGSEDPDDSKNNQQGENNNQQEENNKQQEENNNQQEENNNQQEENNQPGDEQQGDDQQGDDQQGDDQQGEEQSEEAVVGPVAFKVEAETYVQGDGVSVEGDHLGGLNTKAWAMYNVDLADGGYTQVAVRYGADSVGGTVRLWIGDEDYEEFGTMVGEAVFEGTGSWDMNSMVTIDVPDLGGQSGPTDLVVEWVSPEGESDYLMNPDWFEFYKVTSAGAKIHSWDFFENDFSGSEWAGYRGEPDYTHIYVAGGCSTAYKLDFGEEGGYSELALIGDFVGDCELELHLDSIDGELVGTVSFAGAADWNDSIIQTNSQVVSVPELANVTGAHSLYMVFKGGDFNFAAFRFFNKPAAKLSERIEAENVIENHAWVGTDVDPLIASGGGEVGGTTPGTWVVYRLDFEDGGYNKVMMSYGTITKGGTIEVRYGDPNGELITTIALNAADAPDDKAEDFGSSWEGWAHYELDVPELAGITGEQIICFVFQTEDGWVGNFDYYEFSK